MIIDAHLHLWINKPEKYPWDPIGGYIPENEAPLSNFKKLMDENNIAGAVLVQPTPYGWDNSYLFSCKYTDPEKFKAVILVDPFSDQAVKKLQQLIWSGADGLRINLHLKSVKEWENKNFYELLEKCVSLKMPVCFQMTPDYLNLLHKLAVAIPGKYIIDHMGRPELGSQPTDEKFMKFLALSEHSNIYIKLSGMNYYSQESAPYQDTWALLEAANAHFGSEHCMWGSDFPFVEEHWSYAQLLDMIRHHLGFTDDELDWILGKTAKSLWWQISSG